MEIMKKIKKQKGFRVRQRDTEEEPTKEERGKKKKKKEKVTKKKEKIQNFIRAKTYALHVSAQVTLK